MYVGIFAWRSGTPAKGYDASITELEFREAEKHHKQCLIFLLSDDAPWPRKFIDKDATKIENLRDTARANHTADYFTTPDELARKVTEAIHKWEKEQEKTQSALNHSTGFRESVKVESTAKIKPEIWFCVPLPDSRLYRSMSGHPPLDARFHDVHFRLRRGNDDFPEILRVPNNDEVAISVDIQEANSIYFLHNTDFAFKDYGNGVSGRRRHLGSIELIFFNHQPVKRELIFGVNIRDWCPQNKEAIIEWENDHDAIEAYREDGNPRLADQDSRERGLIVDLLEIRWIEPAHLKRITIKNDFSTPLRNMPSIFVWAITCKIV